MLAPAVHWVLCRFFIFIEDTLLLDVPGVANVALAGMANPLGQGAAALAGDFDEAGIAGDLVEKRQGALGFRKHALAEVVFKLQ